MDQEYLNMIYNHLDSEEILLKIQTKVIMVFEANQYMELNKCVLNIL